MADKANSDDASRSLPSEGMPTIDKRWVSQDLEMLRSGLLADAEIYCSDGATPRKVHRNILAGRSTWFKKAFFGNFKEAEQRKVKLQETAWRVDLMLYFFYTGGIDMGDETLTSGRDVMDIGVELLRLGDFFQSKSMRLYGLEQLILYLSNLLSGICDTNTPAAVNETRFKEETDFPLRFCGAVVNAYDKDRPVEVAQRVFADFAFLGRIHLFKNKEFVSLVKEQVVPEFGNLVLTALMTGSVSNAFQTNYTFGKWKDWQVNPSYTPIASNESSANAVWGRGRGGRGGRTGRGGFGGG